MTPEREAEIRAYADQPLWPFARDAINELLALVASLRSPAPTPAELQAAGYIGGATRLVLDRSPAPSPAGREKGFPSTPTQDAILARVGPPPVDHGLLREVAREAMAVGHVGADAEHYIGRYTPWERLDRARAATTDDECTSVISTVLAARKAAGK